MGRGLIVALLVSWLAVAAPAAGAEIELVAPTVAGAQAPGLDGKADPAWSAARGSEDRLNLAWPIGAAVADFAARGCQGLCHKTEGVMRTAAPGERVDLWYWMSQRTNPVGVADNWVMADAVAAVQDPPAGRP